MNTLPNYTIDAVVKKLPAEVIRCLQGYDGSLILAGGAIRAITAGEAINDFDLFATKQSVIAGVSSALSLPNKEHKTKNSYTFRQYAPTVQVIHRAVYPTPEALLQAFDFTICKAAIWHSEGAWQSAADEQFEDDVMARTLRYTPSTDSDPVDSLKRVIKFAARGYTPTAATLAKLVLLNATGLSNGNPLSRDYESLAIAISGSDIAADWEKQLGNCDSGQ